MTELKTEDLSVQNTMIEAVAVIGLAGRFPKAKNLDEFWQRLRNGDELVQFFSDEELLDAGTDASLLANPNFVKAKAMLEDAEFFDASFFGYNPREAEIIDPQQRLFLECAWEALENAGYDSERYPGAIGVYAGLSMNTYFLYNLLSNPDLIQSFGSYGVMLGNDKDFLQTRVSYKLNLRGPSVNIQTACSTSLVAVQMACQSLLNYQCDMALAGGVSVSSPRKSGYLYQPGMIMSPDGHCRAFDARAQGIVSGEGVGIVVLKRLSDALADQDTIHAVIKGAAINNDGASKVGFTAPSVNGQIEVIATALSEAGIDASSITYVEAHGTGTELGDPIEISALTQAFRLSTREKNYCALGTVKTNMGHLDAAAGVAGLIKTILSMENKLIPPSLHFEKPNPKIDFSDSPFYVNSTLSEWKSSGMPRRAGVSSFGIGGTNAHVILEEAPQQTSSSSSRSVQLLMLSAKTSAALDEATRNLATNLRQSPDIQLTDVAYTLQLGRRIFPYRRVVLAENIEAAAASLESLDPRSTFSNLVEAGDRAVIFMFPGQGSQYLNMGLDLYRNEQAFRQQVDTCSELLKPHLSLDLRSILYPSKQDEPEAERLLLQTFITQPALFVIEYALAQQWKSWGIQPRAMIGHSIGEYVAACLSGVFSLEDAMALVAARGRMMQSQPKGSMLAVSLSEQEVLPFLKDDISLAAVNAPELCVLSGSSDTIDALNERLTSQGFSCRHLHTSHAFHSSMMDPVLEPFKQEVSKIRLSSPSIPYVSNLTGAWITSQQATDPDYWAAQLRSTVRFSQGISQLSEIPGPVFLEVGPGHTLSGLIKQHRNRSSGLNIYSSMRHPHEPASDLMYLLTALGRLWLSGVPIDWAGFYAGQQRRRIPLPTYPFERKRYWVEPKKNQPVRTATIKVGTEHRDKDPLQKNKDISDWFYIPIWKQSVSPQAMFDIAALSAGIAAGTATPPTWLIFCDDAGIGDKLSLRLKKQGNRVNTVQVGDRYASLADDIYTLNPSEKTGYTDLVRALNSLDRLPDHILHLWSISSTPEIDLAGALPATAGALPATAGALPAALCFKTIEKKQDMGFYSLIALHQALYQLQVDRKIQIDVISNNLHDITGEETLDPVKSLVLGPCKIYPQIYPSIQCRNIDIVLPDSEDGIEKLVDLLESEIIHRSSHDILAYRGAHRWIQTYEKLNDNGIAGNEADGRKIPLIREHGIYLITGGLGGIGLVLAEQLASSAHARLILVGRTGLPERSKWAEWLQAHDEQDRTSLKIRKVQALETLGAEVMVASCDVTDPDQTIALVKDGCARFGSINGVIHAAGLLEMGDYLQNSLETAAKVLEPKTVGTIALHIALEGQNLDFFLFCSSISTAVGGTGPAYCAANYFLDAFARQQDQQSRTRYIAVDWGNWQQVGLAADAEVPENLARWKEESLKKGILPKEGQEAFLRILSTPLPQIVVSPQNLEAINDWMNLVTTGPQTAKGLLAEWVEPQEGVESEFHPRPGLSIQYIAPSNDTEKRIADIWRTLLGIEQIGIKDDFFELGGHSLLATQVISRLHETFNINLPLRAIFEAPTVAGLAERIDTIFWAARGSQVASTVDQKDREELEF